MYDAQVINMDDCFVDVIDYVEGIMHSVMINRVVGGGFGGYVCGGSRSHGSVVYGDTEKECVEKLFGRTNFLAFKKTDGYARAFPYECLGYRLDMFSVKPMDGGVLVEAGSTLSGGREDRFLFVPSRRVVSPSKLWFGYYWQVEDKLVLMLKLDTDTIESVTFDVGKGRPLGRKALGEDGTYDIVTLRSLMFRGYK